MEEVIAKGYLPILTSIITYVASYAVTCFKVNHLTAEVQTLKDQQSDLSIRLAKLDLMEFQMGEMLKKVSKIDSIATDVAILRGNRNES